ncbi:glycosyltransferase [Candidatus Woesearchaeota archaeon]|nr:glycosyltransferase [Candidatus Woesearchaeota archaeon]
MFGWEFPPFSKGGLGTACYGLTRGLNKLGSDVIFVVPRGKRAKQTAHINLIVAENLYIDNEKLIIRGVDSLLHAYMSSKQYADSFNRILAFSDSSESDVIYGRDLFEEVERYAQKGKVIACFEDFDVIHAHDWMTYKAGIQAKKASGKPLVIHVHATEFDRTGGHPSQAVYDIERQGMHSADRIITVSNYTKNMIMKHYGIEESKIEVVYNGIYFDYECKDYEKIGTDDKVVLFLGRITLQKGPDYFLEAAKRVLDYMPDVKFVVAGSGDMHAEMIERAAHMGIGKNVLFTGFLKGEDIHRAYRMADLYVMPSISEPFGITPLESLQNGTPVLISKQSGVSEVLTNALKVDFWDIDEMTNKMISALNYPCLNTTLAHEGKKEVELLSWDKAAEKCIDVYSGVV